MDPHVDVAAKHDCDARRHHVRADAAGALPPAVFERRFGFWIKDLRPDSGRSGTEGWGDAVPLAARHPLPGLGARPATGVSMSDRLSRRTALLLGAGALASVAAPATAQVIAPTANTVFVLPGVGRVTTLTYRAKVVSANPATRRVVLETPNGKRWAVKAPLIVGDLSLLRNGETIIVRLVPGLVTALGKARQGVPGEVINDVGLNDGLPGWPEGFGVRRVTITTILVNIDKVSGTISFEGPDGYVRAIKAADQKVLADLAQVNIGDLCQITYVEAVAFNALP